MDIACKTRSGGLGVVNQVKSRLKESIHLLRCQMGPHSQVILGESRSCDCPDIVDFSSLDIGHKLGSGTFGTVYEARWRNNDQLAVKSVTLDPYYKHRELEILSVVKHPHIIELIQAFEEELGAQSREARVFKVADGRPVIKLHIVTDRFDFALNDVHSYYGAAARLIVKGIREEYRELVCHKVFTILWKVSVVQLFRALAYLEALEIGHRDIKPHNVLLSCRDWSIRLCDFGSAKALTGEEPSVPYICSRYYRAPELMLGAKYYGAKVDVWSSVLVMAEVYCGETFFAAKTNAAQFVEVVHQFGAPSVQDLHEMRVATPPESRNWPRDRLSMTGFIATKMRTGESKIKKLLRDVQRGSTKTMVELLCDHRDRIQDKKQLRDVALFFGDLLKYSPIERPSPLAILANSFFDDIRVEFIRIADLDLKPFDFTELERKVIDEYRGLSGGREKLLNPLREPLLLDDVNVLSSMGGIK